MKNSWGITIFFVMIFSNLLEAVNSKPTMSRVYGNQYTQGVEDTQPAGIIGQLVPTGIFGSDGNLDLSSQVINAQAIAISILPNGIIVVLFNDGSNSYMVEYTADGSVNSSFAAGTGNKLTLSGLRNGALSIAVDEQQRFLIAGQDDSSSLPWIRRITPDGIVDTTFNFTDGASWGTNGSINQLGIQTLGGVVAIGFNGTNAMLARYNLDGTIDRDFGIEGYVIFDGSENLPVSEELLTNLYIDQYNNLYVAYVNESSLVYVTRLTFQGFIDFGWNSGDPVEMSYLNDASIIPSQLRMILNSAGDLVVAIQSGNSPTVIKATSIQVIDGSAGSFADFETSGGIFGTDSYNVFNMLASSDGKVYFVGSDLTEHQMLIIRTLNSGILDETFNSQDTPGANFFYPAEFMPSVYADINSIALAPDGQIFTVGAQLNSGTTTPYLSCFYSNQYVYPIVQYPQSREQGTLDTFFGNGFTETYPGVICPFVGLYRSSMQQSAETVIDLISGSMLIGSSGYTNSNNYTSMILIRLTSAGLYDNSFGMGGKLILENSSTPSVVSEYITSVLEDGDENLYVTGYSTNGAIFRKYSRNGTLLWNSDYMVSGFQGQGVGFEGPERVILFLSGPDSTGQINAYHQDDGTIDLRFNYDNTPGYLLSTDFNLHIGALYNGAVGDDGTIFIGYKNTVTSGIDVAAVFNPGSDIFWVKSDVFAGYPSILPDNVRVSFNADGNIAVVAARGDSFLVSVLNVATGNPVPLYTTPLVITCGTSVQLRQLIGVSDNTLMIIGYDDLIDDSMLVVRVAANGTLDQTFNSQGMQPGILSIKIGDQVSDYYARVGSGITVQSHVGLNQGNLIVSGYEQMFINDVTPTILRIFGTPGTTQVKNSPIRVRIPGELDPSYGDGGIAITEIPDLQPPLNQEVRAIRQLTGTNIMTVITDNNTSISYTQRLLLDSTVDTTYAGGLGVAIVKLGGTEVVQTMVFDGSGNFLVTGSNSNFGGFIKRILPDGSMDQSFGGSSSSVLSYPLGTVYGIMDTINACQQLTNGNIVIVGSSNGVGVIQMLNSSGNLIKNFGSGGQVSLGINATSVSVDASNNIYVSIAYIDTDTTLKGGILKLNESGQRVNGFAVNGFISSALAEIDNPESLRFAFDDSGRMCIAGSFGQDNGQLAVNRFSSTGQVDSTFNGGFQLNIQFLVTTNVVVTSLVTLENNKILIGGYQASLTPENNFEFVACINQLGHRDHSFGAGGLDGLVTIQALPSLQIARRLCNLNVQTNGNILLCGGEVPTINEETPLTMRLYGYPDVQPVPQFTGYQPISVLPNILNPLFNGNGISETSSISGLFLFGGSAIDDFGRIVVSGVTESGLFIAVRYLNSGVVDANFGVDGVATTLVPITGLIGGHVAIDRINRVYISGLYEDKLIVARFTADGILDIDNFGLQGVAQSYPIPNLATGGFVAINTLGKALVSGSTTDGNFVVTRFLSDGSVDESFGNVENNYVAYVSVPNLELNGGLVTDTIGDIYLSGKALTEMVIAKLDNDGNLVVEYGTDGIGSSGSILGLVQGGAIASNSHNQITLGGLTANHSFVVVRFRVTGDLDPLFNDTGIAYSDPVNVLNQFGGITVDSQDRIVLTGIAQGYQQALSMIAARFTQLGVLDTGFTSVGMATSGPIVGLITGGSVVTDVYDEVIIAGLTDKPGFVVVEMYSGDEIFIDNPSLLNPQDLRVYYYGNNTEYLTQTVSLRYLARNITSPIVKLIVLRAVADIVSVYDAIYRTRPGYNLVWNFDKNIGDFEAARVALIALYSGSAVEIDEFFAALNRRAEGMKFSSSQGRLYV